MGKQMTSKKVARTQVSVKPSVFELNDGTVMTHMQLFSHLVAAGPTMHGTPGRNSKKSH